MPWRRSFALGVCYTLIQPVSEWLPVLLRELVVMIVQNLMCHWGISRMSRAYRRRGTASGKLGAEMMGEFIRLVRQGRGLTLEQVGKSVGASRQRISNYETAQDNIPTHLMEKLAFALSLPAEEFGKMLLRCYHPVLYKMIFDFPKDDRGMFQDLYEKALEDSQPVKSED